MRHRLMKALMVIYGIPKLFRMNVRLIILSIITSVK